MHSQTVHGDTNVSWCVLCSSWTGARRKLFLGGILLRIEPSGLAHLHGIRAPNELQGKVYAFTLRDEVSPDTAPGDRHHAGKSASTFSSQVYEPAHLQSRKHWRENQVLEI